MYAAHITNLASEKPATNLIDADAFDMAVKPAKAAPKASKALKGSVKQREAEARKHETAYASKLKALKAEVASVN